MLAALGEGQKPQGASDTARRMVRLAASAAIPSSDQICLGLAYDHLEEHSDFKRGLFPAQGSTHGDDRLRPPLREGSSMLSGYLLVERPTPSAGAYANHAGEDSGEVALISKAAGERHIQQRQSIVAQLLLGKVDATREKPVVRRCSRGAAKRAREMTHRQAALPSHLVERHTTIEVGAENFLGAPLLPRPGPAVAELACPHRFEQHVSRRPRGRGR
jgi:hypothetical protein